MKQRVMVMCGARKRQGTTSMALAMLVVSAMLAASCATMNKSLLTGVSVGVTAGVVTSAVASGGKRTLTGALVGAALGAASSYLIHSAVQKRDAKTRKQALLNLDKFAVSKPTGGQSAFGHAAGVHGFRLSAPDVDKECFDWEVRGNRLVQQHCVWTIRGNSSWLPRGRSVR